MKLSALIIAAYALAPMQAFASTGSDKSSVPAPSAQPLIQLANSGDDNNNVCGNGALNILNCNDVDVGITL